jgi:hypothetical protein
MFLILAFAIAMLQPSFADTRCRLYFATSWYTTITAGHYQLLFDDESGFGPLWPDKPAHGDAFITTNTDSFRIAGPNGTCWAAPEVGIVTMPVFIGNGRYLYISTYSGGDAYLFVVDAQSCKTLWQSPDLDGGTAQRRPYGFFLPGVGRAVVGPGCMPRLVEPQSPSRTPSASSN